MIASASSGQGKTTFTATLARAYINMGLKVAVFKIGPDYLDPMIHQVATDQPVYNLDLWIMGEQHCQALLFNAAQTNDVILIESLMGLHDNQPSSAAFAQRFNIPVLLLMNVAKYAQTAAAIVHGLQNYPTPGSPPFTLYGVVGNRVGSDNHHRILQETLGDRYLGSIRRDDALEIPYRHLGLIQAQELNNLEQMLQYASKQLLNDALIDKTLLQTPPTVTFSKPILDKTTQHYANKTIAIAKDAAFSFIYPANIDYLINQGASLKYFSPLQNEAVPTADMLWLPGGYPELYLTTLTNNAISKHSIQTFCDTDKPVLAECGGFIYLLDSITDQQGNSEAMCGVIPGTAKLEKRFQGLGLQSRQSQAGLTHAEIRGHSFHHTKVTTQLKPDSFSNKQNGELGEAVFHYKNISATYMHHYFPSTSNCFWF
ncbi:cobyrinate a,c-diamide synthase [Beggiatoa alba]|nr:cobyrinate a,c-diamide synthase [Beggiatoa alba]